METENKTINIDSPYIKLSVSTKGVYTWDIKVIGLDVEQLAKLDEKLRNKFGTQGAGGLIINGAE